MLFIMHRSPSSTVQTQGLELPAVILMSSLRKPQPWAGKSYPAARRPKSRVTDDVIHSSFPHSVLIGAACELVATFTGSERSQSGLGYG